MRCHQELPAWTDLEIVFEILCFGSWSSETAWSFYWRHPNVLFLGLWGRDLYSKGGGF